MLSSLSLGSCNCYVNLEVWLQMWRQLLCSRSAQPWVCRVCVCPGTQRSLYLQGLGGSFQDHNLTGSI